MLKKEIFSLVLVVIVLTIFACADRNNRNIEPYTEVVEPVKEYIEEMISEDATLVDSTCRVQYESVSDKKNQIMNSSVNAQAYTYCITSGEDQTFYTIFAVEVSEKITQNDHLEISINDYLLNYSPEDGRVFSKKDQTSGWAKTRDITPVATDISHGNTITVFGSEIESESSYNLVLLSFPSMDNPTSEALLPEYTVTFYQDDRIHIPLWVTAVLAVLFLMGFGVFRHKKRMLRSAI